MSGLDNPFNLQPAPITQFVGRSEILERWKQRLTPGSDDWNNSQSWLIIGNGGVGKTSLVHKMSHLAQSTVNAHVINLDLGHYRQLNRDEDFFYFLDTHLPPAQRWSSRLRVWLDLPPGAPEGEVNRKFLSLLSNLALAFAPGGSSLGGELDLSFLRQESGQPSAFGLRLVQAFNTLAILSEEQKDRPVVLLVDQMGKIHDAYRWLLVGHQLLQMAERIYHHKTSNIICVFVLRPERKGLLEHELEYYLRTPLFKSNVFHTEHLHPFQQHEAVWAIVERTKGKTGWDYSLAGKITRALNASLGIDPYHVIVGAAALWDHLYSGDEQKLPHELADTDVYEIVSQGHSYQLESVRRRSATQWAILSLLSYYPSGLDVETITQHLNNHQKNLSLHEVEQAIGVLSNQAGYRLLDATFATLPVRYTLAHDILREQLQRQLPPEERLNELVQKLLDDGSWQYKNHFSEAPFNEQNLALLWQHSAQLLFSTASWEAIVNSELNVNETRLVQWMTHYPNEIQLAVIKLEKARIAPYSSFGHQLIVAYIHPSRRTLFEVLRVLLYKMENIYRMENSPLRQRVMEELAEIGELDVTIPMLSELVKGDRVALARRQAAETLAKIGERDAAIPVLVELAQSAREQEVRQQSAEALAKLGERDVSVLVLTELAQSAREQKVRVRAIETIVMLVEQAAAIPVLMGLAQSANDLQIRKRAIEALAKLGERDVSTPFLVALAQSSRDQQIQQVVAEALAKIGEREVSIPILTKLAQSTGTHDVYAKTVEEIRKIADKDLSNLARLAESARDDTFHGKVTEIWTQLDEPTKAMLSTLANNTQKKEDRTRLEAARVLAKIGERAVSMPVLSELAQDSEEEWVRLQAIEVFSRIDEHDIALPILENLAQNAKDVQIRQQAVEAIAEISERDASMPMLWDWEDANVNFSLTIKTQVLTTEDGKEVRKPEMPASGQDIVKSVYQMRRRISKVLRAGETVVPVLTELAESAPNFWARYEVVKALSQIGEPAKSVLSTFALNVQEEEDQIRQEAAAALARIGVLDTALPVLTELAQSAWDDDIRNQAIEVLGQIGEPASLALLQIALSDTDVEIAQTAALHLVIISKRRMED